MNKLVKHITVVAFLSIALLGTSSAEQESSVTRTSPNHTKIVIRNSKPSAKAEQKERARLREERREREKERAHELELARIRAGSSETSKPQAAKRNRQQAPEQPILASIEERQRRHAERNQPPAFFNGGQWTGLGGFALGGPGIGFANQGFWGPGFIQPWQGNVGQGFRNRGIRNRGFRNRGVRNRGIRNRGFRNRGYRGRGYRGCR